MRAFQVEYIFQCFMICMQFELFRNQVMSELFLCEYYPECPLSNAEYLVSVSDSARLE